MRLPKLVRTATFRLALTQAALFAATAAVLFVTVYRSMVGFATEELRAAVDTEAAELADERATDGAAELLRTVDYREKSPGFEGHSYLVLGPDGRVLAGALRPPGFGDSPGKLVGWHVLPSEAVGDLPQTDDEPHSVVVLGRALPTGEMLLVGRDTRRVGDVGERLVDAFGGAAALTLALAILSGVITSLGVLRRVEAVGITARSIMDGALGERVPRRGTDDEFDRLADNLNLMLQRIEGLMDGLRQVSSDIAHDLRTPLTHLKQRLEEARHGPRTAAAFEEAIEAASGDVDAILRVFASLLRIAQVEAGTRRSGFTELDLSAVFCAIGEVYGPVAEDAGQSLDATIEPGLIMRGDRDLLTQMLANLVENAIRYAGGGARIALTLRRDGALLHGTVSDTGPGIAPEARARVFGRFVRLDTARPGEGHGLGLALVKAVADLHGIRIDLVDAGPGLSAALTILPVEAASSPRPSAC